MKATTLLVPCALWWCAQACAIELSLGIAELPPCPTAKWEGQSQFGLSAPSRGQSSQTIRVKAIVEGENLQDSAVLSQVHECAMAASQRVNLRFLASEPSEGNALFKSIFGKCMDSGRVATRIYFTSLKLEGYCERLTIYVPASRFVRAERVAVASGQVARYGEGVVLNAPPYASGPNAAEYQVVAPTPGAYRFEAEYAAAESRPLVVSVNGEAISRSAFAETTGCWDPVCQRWMSQGLVRLRQGQNSLRLETTGVFPHIRTMRFTPIE